MNKNIIKLLLEETDEKKIKSLITKRVEELCKQREEELSYYTAPQIKLMANLNMIILHLK